MKKIIKRGEVYYANLNPAIGSEQGGFRPVIITQNDRGNYYSPTTIVVPLTSREKTYLPTHCTIDDKSVLPYKSYAMAEQLRVIDKQRLGRCVGTLDKETMQRLGMSMLISLAIEYDLLDMIKPLDNRKHLLN